MLPYLPIAIQAATRFAKDKVVKSDEILKGDFGFRPAAQAMMELLKAVVPGVNLLTDLATAEP